MELVIIWATIGFSAAMVDSEHRATSIEYEAEVQMAQLTEAEKSQVLAYDPELDGQVSMLAKNSGQE